MKQSESPILRRITLVSAVGAGMMIVALMCLTVIDVALRTAGSGGVPGGIEWTEVVLVIAVYFGMMTAEFDDAHVKTPLLTDRLKAIPAEVLRLVGTVAISALVIWMIYATTESAIHAISVGEVHPGIARVPIWPARLIIPIGLLGMLIVFIVQGIHRIQHIRQLIRSSAATTSQVEGNQ